jgi:hypothetical protein
MHTDFRTLTVDGKDKDAVDKEAVDKAVVSEGAAEEVLLKTAAVGSAISSGKDVDEMNGGGASVSSLVLLMGRSCFTAATAAVLPLVAVVVSFFLFLEVEEAEVDVVEEMFRGGCEIGEGMESMEGLGTLAGES